MFTRESLIKKALQLQQTQRVNLNIKEMKYWNPAPRTQIAKKNRDLRKSNRGATPSTSTCCQLNVRQAKKK